RDEESGVRRRRTREAPVREDEGAGETDQAHGGDPRALAMTQRHLRSARERREERGGNGGAEQRQRCGRDVGQDQSRDDVRGAVDRVGEEQGDVGQGHTPSVAYLSGGALQASVWRTILPSIM